MIINEVNITNFFCFSGVHNFKFSKGLNIVSGRNASGKSQLFNAFYWTFFEQIYSDEKSRTNQKVWISANDLSIYPECLTSVMDQGETSSTIVEIRIEANDYRSSTNEADDQVTYFFKREVKFEKRASSLVQILKPELTIEYIKYGETIIVNRVEHESLLDKIFPRSIRKFMWYQGETMDELYDFSNDSTLRKAINEISYFPKYEFMYKVAAQAEKSIDKKIQKEIAIAGKLSKEQSDVFADVLLLERKIEQQEEAKTSITIDIQHLNDEITTLEHKLEGVGQFMDYKNDLTKHEGEERTIKAKIDEIENSIKERLINEWMLNGCSELVKKSETKLLLISLELQDKQGNHNPIPTSLPGPEYVEQMILEKICYICERPVEENTAPYEALRKRLGDFKRNTQTKILQDTYTDLNRVRKRLQTDLPTISQDIMEYQKKKDDLLKRRGTLRKKISNILDDLGDDRSILDSSADTIQKNINKTKTLRIDLGTKNKRFDAIQSDLDAYKIELRNKKIQRDSITITGKKNIIETHAGDYIKVFVTSLGILKDQAYKYLIEELERESNKLYSLYLGGREQGKIEFKKGAQVVDQITKNKLTDLNMGEQVAQKLAVANAFLSLSAKKMNRSYPMIADAPSSDLDAFNTHNLTVNIGKSFEQIIVMSKDYVQFNSNQIESLINEANITSFYIIENNFINNSEGNSRGNRSSQITKIK